MDMKKINFYKVCKVMLIKKEDLERLLIRRRAERLESINKVNKLIWLLLSMLRINKIYNIFNV